MITVRTRLSRRWQRLRFTAAAVPVRTAMVIWAGIVLGALATLIYNAVSDSITSVGWAVGATVGVAFIGHSLTSPARGAGDVSWLAAGAPVRAGRVEVRAPRPGDRAAFDATFTADVIAPWGWSPQAAKATRRIVSYPLLAAEAGVFVLTLDEEVIGGLTFGEVVPTERSALVGYWLRPDAHGHEEAVIAAATELARLGDLRVLRMVIVPGDAMSPEALTNAGATPDFEGPLTLPDRSTVEAARYRLAIVGA